jgi:putative addiction module CopG family antidote
MLFLKCFRVCSYEQKEDDLMSVTLPPEIEARVRPWLETGQFADADAVLLKALDALEAQEEAKFLKLRELVLVGHDSGIAGELTEEMWDEIERSSEERFQRGDEPSPHVCP